MDESGKPTFKDKENYTLASLCIHEKYWQTVDNKVNELKSTYFPNLSADKVEFHAKEIAQGDSIYKSMKLEERMQIFEDIYTLIAKTECNILSTLIDKTKIYAHNFDIEYWALKLLFERICIWLEKQNEKNELPEHAILLIDSVNTKYDQKRRDKLLPWIRRGTCYRNNKYIIEDPLFVTSSYRSLSQLTDCIAYCIRRKYRPSKKKLDGYFDKFFEIIYKKIDKNKYGDIINAGLKIFPP